jgi:phospholipase C
MLRPQTVTTLAVILFVLCLGFSLAWGQNDVLTRYNGNPQSGLHANETLPMPADVTTPITNVVFLMKENHSFDSLFGTFPGAAGTTTGVTSKGQTITLSHASDSPPNFAHSWQMFILAQHGGKMDWFDKTTKCGSSTGYACYTQYQQADLPNYWTYAQTYLLADNFFSSSNGPSYPNHQYLIASQSGSVVNNPTSGWGCDAKSTSTVQTYDLVSRSYGFVFPCFDYLTFGDILDAAGVSWHYYAPNAKTQGYIWSAYDAIKHIRYGADWTNILDQKTFESDALAGRLAAVNWVTVDWNNSEHPSASLTQGENRTVSIVNAIMNGPQWASTAIFITWDDPGGFYDHVSPPKIDGYGAGIRVPLLIISPYVVPQVYHQQATFDSLLAFAEANWQLPSLTSRDAAANNLMDAFNFSQPRLPRLNLPLRKVKLSRRQRQIIWRQSRDEKEAEGDR